MDVFDPVSLMKMTTVEMVALGNYIGCDPLPGSKREMAFALTARLDELTSAFKVSDSTQAAGSDDKKGTAI